MGNVTYVRGLKGTRAAYPLAFSPEGAYDPTNKLHLGVDCIVMGSGVSGSYPETSSVAGARFLEWHFETTNTGAEEVYGNYMTVRSAGTGTGYVYGYGGIASSQTGGYVAELAACYFKSQLTAGTVTGQSYVGFFEYIVDTAVANMPSGGVLQLVDIISGALNADHGYIAVRTYGTYPFSNLFNIKDHSVGSNSHTVLVSSTGEDIPCSHTIKIKVGTDDYWIMLSDDHAA